jgi:hypothetical protein
VGYLVADLLEFGVGGVGVVFEEVGAAWGLLDLGIVIEIGNGLGWVGIGRITVGDEIDWGFGHVADGYRGIV